jgi:hypothetical protein
VFGSSIYPGHVFLKSAFVGAPRINDPGAAHINTFVIFPREGYQPQPGRASLIVSIKFNPAVMAGPELARGTIHSRALVSGLVEAFLIVGAI